MNPNERPAEAEIKRTEPAEENAKAFIMNQPPRPAVWAKQTIQAQWEKAMEAMTRPEQFLTVVRTALERVDPIYYSPSAGVPELINAHPLLQEKEAEALIKYLRRHHERVFCYELYHQIRVLMDLYPKLFPEVRLQGELKKFQLGPELLARFNFGALEKEYVPDFLLHGPGHAGDEDVVIEVKCDPLLKLGDAQDDLKKIQEFITQYHYKAGLFLSVNTDPTVIRAMLETRESRAWIKEHLPDAARISWIWKQAPNAPILEHTLSEFWEKNAWE